MNQDKLAAVAKVIGTGRVSEMSAAEILGKAINGDRHALARSLTLLENGDLTESDLTNLSSNPSSVGTLGLRSMSRLIPNAFRANPGNWSSVAPMSRSR